jgi:hypothetical protein
MSTPPNGPIKILMLAQKQVQKTQSTAVVAHQSSALQGDAFGAPLETETPEREAWQGKPEPRPLWEPFTKPTRQETQSSKISPEVSLDLVGPGSQKHVFKAKTLRVDH